MSRSRSSALWFWEKRFWKGQRTYVKASARRKAALSVEGLECRNLLSVMLASGFPGLASDLSATPPDTQMAVGPTEVGEAVNTSLQFFNKSGGPLFGDSLDTLFSSVRNPFDVFDSTVTSDPSIHYDADNGRFVLSVLYLNMTTNQAYLDFAISTNSQPAGPSDFLAGQITVTESAASGSPNHGSTLWTDFDRYGSSANAYVFTFNMFTFPISSTSLFDHVQVLAINKSAILSPTPSLAVHTVDLPGWNGSAIVNENLAPVDMHGAQATDPMYFVEETSYGSATNSQLRLLKVANVLTAASGDFQSFDVTVPTYTTNPVPDAAHPWNSGDMNANAPQLNSTTDQMQTNDTRILSAAWRRDAQGVEHLVASQTVGATLARARWYEFITSTFSPTLNQSGDVGAAGAASYFPSIDISPNGNIGVNFLESSSSEYMSMYVTGRSTSDSLNSMQPPMLAKAGEAVYTFGGSFFESSPHRAGDYSGIGVDIDSLGNPLNTFWAANEYTGSSGLWATWLSNFSVTPANPLAPITVSATANPLTATMTALSATATDPNAGATLTKYTWSVQSGPSGVTFDSNNGTPAGSNVTATFSQAGSYTFLVTVTDSLGATGTSTVNVTVQQALTSITVSPNTTTVADNGQKQFTATAFDQFGKAMTTQPSFTWSVDSPTTDFISSTGLYTAPGSGYGTHTVHATAGGVSGTATVTYAQPPTITSARATLNPDGKTAQLTAAATDPNNIGGLIYSWSFVSGPANVTGLGSGSNVTATFSKAGSYMFQVTVTDSFGLSSTQTVNVTVGQILTSVTVSPATASIRVNGTVQFTAKALDQFGNPLAVQPIFAWKVVSGPGKISSNGLYTGTSTGTAVIQATVTGTSISGTATVTVRRH